MPQLTDLTLTQVRDALARKECTAVQAVQACLDRIRATDGTLNAFVTRCDDEALALAAGMDAKGPDPDKPLWGVPISVKDVFTTRNVRTTCSSRILENFVPFYDAHVVARLKEAGAVILGKTNMDEFAMGSSTENSAFGPTLNPWGESRVPGGSSGGSAACVAARQAFGSMGTDTGGSIRQPASFCGVVGLKPTYGRVSRYGLVAFGSSLDQAGPMTRSVADAALMLSVIAGHDDKDSTSSPNPVDDYLAGLGRDNLKGVRIGLPVEFWAEGLDDEVRQALEQGLDAARDLGAETVEVALPATRQAISTYYIICMAEASSNLARFDGVRYGLRDTEPRDLMDLYVRSRTKGFGDEVQRRIMLGTYVLSAGYYDAYYRKAAQVRRLIRDDFVRAFESCDVIAGAASPCVAWKLGELTGDPLKMYLMDIFTISLNLAGLPGMSLPVGLGGESSMPVGMQLIGPAFGEAGLLGAADALERALPPMPAPEL